VDGVPNPLGQNAPENRLRPRDVHEVRERGIGPRVPDDARCEVQVVVVEEHRGVGLRLELGKDCLGERLVDGDIAIVPGVMEPRSDVRRVRQRPQIMLQEPQRRVGHDVVEPVVRRRVVRDEPQPIRRAVACDLVDRVTTCLVGDDAVLIRHRARDPRHVVVRDEAPQRRDETPASAPRHAISLLVPPEGHRAAVGDDDQLSAGRHRRAAYVTQPPRFRARSPRDRSRPAG
jgi:hypothetical protein